MRSVVSVTQLRLHQRAFSAASVFASSALTHTPKLSP